MTLYEEVVLHHYKFHTKNQTPEVSMRIACRQAQEAMGGYRNLLQEHSEAMKEAAQQLGIRRKQ